MPLKDRWIVLKRDNYRCVKCGASPSNNHKVELEVDHIIPVAKGGGNALENLQILCRDCNQGKKDR
ncbi:MAG: HNH endonuclease [Betaproteobacteria bacterium]|nr:HNH endonuclease [Betaproteobacteria bacterium]